MTRRHPLTGAQFAFTDQRSKVMPRLRVSRRKEVLE